MHLRILFLFSAIALAGCSTTRVATPADLRGYGGDPLNHAFYLGSDQRFHYFSAQKGKLSSSLRIPVGQADIKPGPFARAEDRDRFVERVEGRTIYLMPLLERALAPEITEPDSASEGLHPALIVPIGPV